MRKFVVMIIALAALSSLAGVASAGTIQIGGTHSPEEIKATCDKAGGTYTSYGTLYGCFTGCGGGIADCQVSCIGGKCLGTCPSCGERRMSVNRSGLVQTILTGGGAKYSISGRWRPWPGCNPNCACATWVNCPCCIGPGPGGTVATRKQ